METTTPTAREQFVSDYLLVVENDAEMWQALRDWSEQESSLYDLAERIRDEWENAIDDATASFADSAVALLIRQMANGWGIDPFVDIARRVRGE
jgi:hypothetical protein